MKKLLLSLTFVAATYMAQGQHLIGNTGRKDAVIKLMPGSFIHASPATTTGFISLTKVTDNERWLTIHGLVTIMSIDRLPLSGTIDSLIIHIRKSQIRWVNDSTAVIHKP